MAAGRVSAGAGRPQRAGRAVLDAVRRPPTAVGRRIRRATHAHGAGESGLGKLIELHAVNSAGDMLITVALASTVFFSVPTGEARGRVALYLAVTMAPFVLLAPVIGPLLDRLPHGRRAAMAGAMLARAVLALFMAGAVAGGGLELYPAALGVLVSSKSYNIVRSAVVPRLLPHRISLVKANSRITLAGLLATGAAAPLGAVLHRLDSAYPLYGACVIFVAGMFLSLSLAPKVDSARGEGRARLVTEACGPFGRRYGERYGQRNGERTGERFRGRSAEPGVRNGGRPGGRLGERLSSRSGSRSGGVFGRWSDRGRRNGLDQRPGLRTVGGSVLHALIANGVIRVLSGLLLFFLAFMLREHPLPGLNAVFSLGLVGVAAGTGNALGTAIGAWLKDRGPELIIITVLGVLLAAALAATVFYGTVTVTAVAAAAGICQALGKLSLDALIQRDVPETIRTSAFARSETLVQLSWVAGGAIGITLPLIGPLGMAVGAIVIAVGALRTVPKLLSAARDGTPHPRVI